MGFSEDLRSFDLLARQRVRDAFVACTEEVTKSVVDGSALTGAKGQPVDTGYLKSSWIGEWPSLNVYALHTNVAYAPVIEHNDRAFYDDRGSLPAQTTRRTSGGGTASQKSTVGGNHSVKLTIAGWDRIVANVRRRFARG
jgi:hypothetical protein